MSANIGKLIKEANAAIKRDAKTAVEKLEEAYGLAKQAGNDEDTAFVAEELARAWPRRKKVARALYYAHKCSKLAPNQRTSWTTLAKTCELVANRQKRETKSKRMMGALPRRGRELQEGGCDDEGSGRQALASGARRRCREAGEGRVHSAAASEVRRARFCASAI